MALTINDNYLQDLIGAGNDAHSNLYEIVFTGGEFSSSAEFAQNMSIRTSGFTPPSITNDSYPVKYITAFVEWPRAKAEITRNFNIDFRMDANWEVFKKLEKQKNLTLNASHSFAATDLKAIEDKLFKVSVYALKDGMPSENIKASDKKKLYEFHHCWITKIDTPKFNNASSENIKVSVTINFLEMYDLESGFGATQTVVDNNRAARESGLF